MIDQAIILAGGLGTRLRSVVAELPKCMAPVAGKPFLHYILAHLQREGITHIIFSVGYKSDSIIEYINRQFAGNSDVSIQFSVEKEPLGTGGAIRLACKKTSGGNVMICNGDTLFKIKVGQMSNFHEQHQADCTLSVKPMNNFDRYGAVEIGEMDRVISFKEKKFYNTGYINGGVYALNTTKFMKENLPEKFSFEKEYLEKYVVEGNMYALVQDTYFIDIGIPEDYARAQVEFRVMDH